jgi:hypothetical protein
MVIRSVDGSRLALTFLNASSGPIQSLHGSVSNCGPETRSVPVPGQGSGGADLG